MKIRKYKDSDWSEITDAVEPFNLLLPVLHISQRSVAVTGTENGRVMACGGITFISNDEGLVWVKVSEKCKERAYRWARTIIDTFKIMMDSIEDLKVFTYVLSDFCMGDKLARMIGLSKTSETEEYKGNIYCKYTVI